MTCYKPLEAWAHRTLKTPNGKRLISFAPNSLFRSDAEKPTSLAASALAAGSLALLCGLSVASMKHLCIKTTALSLLHSPMSIFQKIILLTLPTSRNS